MASQVLFMLGGNFTVLDDIGHIRHIPSVTDDSELGNLSFGEEISYRRPAHHGHDGTRRGFQPAVGDKQKHRERVLLYDMRECRDQDFVQADLSNVLELPNLAVVELLLKFPLVWRICYRYKLFCDKRYHVHCSSAASLEEIKCMFLDLFQTTVEGEEELRADCVWFTQGNKVVTEMCLLQTFSVESENSSDSLEVIKVSHLGKCVDEVYVHFQPANALCAEVTLKTDGVPTPMGLLVVSGQPASYVREEVAKIVGKEPESIRISLGTVKLDNTVDVHQALTASGCKITVTAKQKIKLTVHMEPVSNSSEKSMHTIPVYSYGTVEVLKMELCRRTEIPAPLVDLFFEGRNLDKGSTFRAHRLRDGDCLEGRVFPRRLTLLVRMPDRGWLELTVDDCSVTTVGQVKVFCQTRSPGPPVHCFELTAIVADRVLSDSQTLDDITAEAHHPQRRRLVLVRTEGSCFTAATSCLGTYIVCSSTKGSHFDQVSTMHNGKRPFYGGPVKESEVLQMVQNRRLSPQQSLPAPGLRLRPAPPRPVNSGVTTASTSPSSAASRAAAGKGSTQQTQQTSLHDDCHKAPGSSGGLQEQCPQPRKKMSSIVRFHTGNSLSDLEAVEEEAMADDQKAQGLLGDGESEGGAAEGSARDPGNQLVGEKGPLMPAEGGGQMEPYQSKDIQTSDPAFRSICERTVRYVAQHLGRQGMMIIRALGVTEDDIDQAATAHPTNLVEKYYQCLRKWCCKVGSRADKEALKKALEDEGRKDLAEKLDELDPGLPEDLPPLQAGLPEDLPPLQAGLPEDLPPLQADFPEDLPPLQAGLPEDLPPLQAGLPEDLLPLQAGLPEDLPPLQAGLPEDLLPLQAGLPEDLPSLQAAEGPGSGKDLQADSP
ncbi:hypothetical protein ACOMHN_000349 [Nucella lapillus]